MAALSRLTTASLRTLARTAHASHVTPIVRPALQVGDVQVRLRSTSTKPKHAPPPAEPEVDIDAELESKGAADLFDEVELDEAEWEGEEVEEGVFVSVPEPAPTSASTSTPGTRPPRPQKTSIKHLNRLLSRHQVPDIPEHELEERFVRGRGPGGQAINKTNSSVSLIHIPTGIRVQSQPTRSRAQNRIIARQILKERLDLMRVRGELPDGVAMKGAAPKGAAATESAEGETEAEAPEPAPLSRKERLAAEARMWSKQELRWEKERRRKANRAKKVKRRKNAEEAEEEGEEDK